MNIVASIKLVTTAMIKKIGVTIRQMNVHGVGKLNINLFG